VTNHSRSIGARLCEEWGIDPHDVQRLFISITPSEAKVVITMARSVDGFAPTLAKYRLTPIEETQ
jgi:hypothetical protein